MGLEATSWDWLRGGVQRSAPGSSLLERVENGVVIGMADVNYLIRGKEGWIELKAVALPKRSDTRVLGDNGLNPEQINWHLKRQSRGGRTWVLISAKPYRWLVSGAHAPTLNELTLEQLCEVARVWEKRTWKAADWGNLIQALAPK